MDAGLVGTDVYEGYLVPDTMTREELSQMAWELAIEHAGSYGDVVHEDEYDCDSEDEISEANINCSWSEYNADEHDGYMLNNSFPEL